MPLSPEPSVRAPDRVVRERLIDSPVVASRRTNNDDEDISVVGELERIYRQHCPEKLAGIPALYAKWAGRGREQELLAKVK